MYTSRLQHMFRDMANSNAEIAEFRQYIAAENPRDDVSATSFGH